MMLKRFLIVALVHAGLLAHGVGAPAHAAGFMCPETTASAMPKGAPAPGDLFAGANDTIADQRLGDLISSLRQSGMKPVFIVDNLIGAYCPLVSADASLSDQQKTSRVQQFARQVTGLAYASSDQSELDVIIDVPMTPTVLQRVDAAARRVGISREAWIRRAIDQRLTLP